MSSSLLDSKNLIPNLLSPLAHRCATLFNKEGWLTEEAVKVEGQPPLMLRYAFCYASPKTFTKKGWPRLKH